jgi:signal peptidase I
VCEYAEAMLVAVLLALFAKAFVFQVFEIPSSSMENTLLIGDHVLVNKFSHGQHEGPWARLLPYREPASGGIVVFRSVEEPDRDLIKRITGIEGDRLEIHDKVLYRNGNRIEEPYRILRDPRIFGTDPETPAAVRPRDNMPSRVLLAGNFFAMGDNRDFSRDSRYWGPAPATNLRGEAVSVLWSLRPETPEEALSGGDQPSQKLRARVIHFFHRIRWQRTFTRVR